MLAEQEQVFSDKIGVFRLDPAILGSLMPMRYGFLYLFDNLFVFPVMIATMMYFDCTFEIRLAVVNNILVVANGIYSAKVLGSDDRTSLNQIYMTVLVVMILNISIYIASKAAEVHNKEEIEELERDRQLQEEMMQSIISAGKVINSAAQSIKGTVSEVAQATNRNE